MSDRTHQRIAVVTGAGSGLGRDIALGLIQKNYRVFGTALSHNEISDLQQASGGSVSLAVCDITNESAVRNWSREVVAQTNGDVDLLISKAGILTPGPLEVLTLDAIRREFEVNVFGALAVMNTFLPALRKARGPIVQISTWTASLPLPFNGPSGASKAAMEVLSAVYRAENQQRIVYHSCKSRACSSCGHRGGTTFTMPDVLWEVFSNNQPATCACGCVLRALSTIHARVPLEAEHVSQRAAG